MKCERCGCAMEGEPPRFCDRCAVELLKTPGRIVLRKPGRFGTSAKPMEPPPPRASYQVPEIWGLTVIPNETRNERKRSDAKRAKTRDEEE